jgi:hypothetical protein
MKLLNSFTLLVTSSLPRLFVLTFGAGCLVLAGCSTNEAGAPKADVNYIEQHSAASNQQATDSDPGYEWFY